MFNKDADISQCINVHNHIETFLQVKHKNLLNIIPSLDASQEDDSLFCFSVFLNLIRNNQWKFRDFIDQVSCIQYKNIMYITSFSLYLNIDHIKSNILNNYYKINHVESVIQLHYLKSK